MGGWEVKLTLPRKNYPQKSLPYYGYRKTGNFQNKKKNEEEENELLFIYHITLTFPIQKLRS